MSLEAIKRFCDIKGYDLYGKNELIVANSIGATMLVVKGDCSIDTDYVAFMKLDDADKKALFSYAVTIASMPYELLREEMGALHGTL